MNLEIIGAPPVDEFSEEISDLAKGEEEAIAEVGG